MSSTSLYRKYRPGKFKDIIGQEHIVSTLKGSLKEKSLSHAYLFCGSRGTGKTSIARILADEIGTSLNDLHEIDAASNRGIDDIREIRESVESLPFDSKYKVYIIDEVHMLTKEAFNALLKTLEEPPAYVVFILATTEFEKLPETIVSRCQTFHFKKPNQAILTKMVQNIAKEEGFELENSSANLIALIGDGSFRDTLGVLQKVISSSDDKKIEVGEVEKITGAPRGELVRQVLSSVSERNTANGLKAINKAVESNVDMLVFLKLILRLARFSILMRFGQKDNIKNDLSDEDLRLLEELNEGEIKADSKVIIKLLTALEQMRFSSVPQLPLELAIIDLTEDN